MARVYRAAQLAGKPLVRRLEALRERHRLNPAEPDETTVPTTETEVVRIVCSDGLVPE